MTPVPVSGKMLVWDFEAEAALVDYDYYKFVEYAMYDTVAIQKNATSTLEKGVYIVSCIKETISDLISVVIIVDGGNSNPTAQANPTSSSVFVNGKQKAFDAYSINGNNYFKLRDLAYVLSGSSKQFEVTWDAANNAIALTSGTKYAPVGGEMQSKGSGAKTATLSTSKILLDGKEVALTAYNIGGNNYFKLRDIGQVFNFGVTWDGTKNTISIDTSIGYTE